MNNPNTISLETETRVQFCSTDGVVCVFTVTQMSTRWRRCSNCTCGSCQNLWCPGPSTRTSWTAPTCWTPAAQRSAQTDQGLHDTASHVDLLFLCLHRAGASWRNRLVFSPELTTTFSVMFVGEYHEFPVVRAAGPSC